MRQTVLKHVYIGEHTHSNYEFVGTSSATKDIIWKLLNQDTVCLDIGFGRGELGVLINSKYPTIKMDGIDAWWPTCNNQNLSDYYRNVWCAELDNLPAIFYDDYDRIFLLDVIEHLDQDIAWWTLREILFGMKENAKLVVSTPLWFFPQGQVEPGDFEEHKCMIPVESFMNLQPELYNINPNHYVGMFVLNKSALKQMDKFVVTTDRNYRMEQAKWDIDVLGLTIDKQWHRP